MNNIYILNEGGKTFETCYLLETSKQYKDCILEEIIFNFELISELKEIRKNLQNQFNIDIDNEIEKIVMETKKEKSKELERNESKSHKLKGIKNNRGFEKEINRESEAFKIGEETNYADRIAEIIEIPNININQQLEDRELKGKNRIMEMLKKKRNERREK